MKKFGFLGAVAIVAVGVALSLWATGVLDLDQALAGFGDPTVVFIASLFVVGEALDASGVTSWAGQQLISRAGTIFARIVPNRSTKAIRKYLTPLSLA
jgi:di/tricarboxylate transporter